MAELTTKKRNSLKKSQFALPSKQAYPINDRAHAANAKARATQELNNHHLTMAEHNTIIAAANKVLKRTANK